MSTLAFICWLAAVVLFVIAAFIQPLFGRLLGLGLALATAGFIFQYGVASHWDFA